MAEHSIDSLYIEIEASAEQADKQVDALIASLKILKTTLGSGFNTNIGNALQGLKNGFNVDVSKLDQAVRQSRRASVVLGNLGESAKKVSEVKIAPKINLSSIEDITKAIKEAQENYNLLNSELNKKQKVVSELPIGQANKASIQLPINKLRKEVDEAKAILDNYQKMLQDATLRENEKRQGIEKFKESVKGLDFKTNLKVPDSLKELQKLIAATEKQLESFRNKAKEGVFIGSIEEGSEKWKSLYYNIEKSTQELDAYKDKLQEVQSEQEKTTDDSAVNKSMSAIVSFSTLSKSIGNFTNTLDRMSGKMSTVLVNLYAPLRHVVSEFKDKLGKVGNTFKKLHEVVKHQTDKIKYRWNSVVHSFSKMVMRRALYAVLTTINDAMGSLANFAGITGQKFNAAMSDMTASARYAGANIVAAFSPLINAVAPMIDALVEKLVNAITVINQFFSALTGNNVYVKAKKVVLDYADSVNKAEKAQKDLVLGIDELNINNPDKNNAGGEESAFPGYEWEEIPVENKIRDFANKVKDILNKLFDPLKEAWKRAGDYVINGFKYMVGEIGKLASDIGRDFLKMWNEEETIKIFENILGIIGDIEYTIGNLARNFREAWNENEIGLKIFRNMRDIIGILIQHVRNVTKYMKEWSETIDFKPLLNSINDLLEALKPVADFLGGVFEDIMERVVLRHIKWLIEEGIPHLNETLASIADAFDWDKLRTDIQPVEDAFENLAEAIHTGVVNALGNLGEALAGITNTETFTHFMENIAGIINLIDAELVEKVLTALGDCILDIADALVGFVGSETFTNFLDDVKKYLDGLTAEDIKNIIEGLAIAIGTFKFTQFVGAGIKGFLNLMTALSSIGNLGGAAGTINAVATAISAVGTALSTGVGITLITKHYIEEIQTFKDNLKSEDIPGALASAFEIAEPENVKQTLNEEIVSILEYIDIPKKVDEIISYFTGDENSLYSKLWQFVYHDLPEMFDFSGQLLNHAVEVATGQSKSLRDLVEENVREDSNALRDLREVTTSETSTMSEKYEALKNNIKEAFKSAKSDSSSAVQEMLQSLKDKFSEIRESIGNKVSEIKENISEGFENAKKNVSETVEGLFNSVKGIWDDIVGFFEEKIQQIKNLFDFDLEFPEIKFPHIELPHFYIEGEFNLREGRIPHIGIDWYANGGFVGMPNSYSLFGAGENGIPELLGTVGGKTAVAGGEEITGIKEQVYQSGVAEQELLNQAISLLQVIANKDFSVDLDGRSMVSALSSRSSRNGYSMATVS